jgi:hypothetical protein
MVATGIFGLTPSVAWFPHYVSGRLKYAIGENPHVSPNHGR